MQYSETTKWASQNNWESTICQDVHYISKYTMYYLVKKKNANTLAVNFDTFQISISYKDLVFKGD